MESRINLEDLLLHQLDRTFEMKGRLESKAVGFLTAIALIIGTLVNFLLHMLDLDICPIFKWLCFWVYVVLFTFSVILFLISAFTLKPKKTQWLEFNELFDLFKQSDAESKTNLDEKIIYAVKTIVNQNDTTILRLEKYNKVVAFGLIVLGIFFVFACILFFISIGVLL